MLDRQFSRLLSDAGLIFNLPDQSHFRPGILDSRLPLDPAMAQHEWLRLAESIQRARPSLGLWLFECANMPSYSRAVAEATGLPVYDAIAIGNALYQSVQP